MPTSTLTLQDKLVVLNSEQYQAVFAIYGQTGLDKFDTLTKSRSEPDEFQSTLNSFIEKDDKHDQKTKLIQVIEKYYDDYLNENNQLASLTEVARDATRAKNNFKKVFNTTIATFTNSFEDLVSEEIKGLIENRKLKEQADNQYQKREKVRKTGKRAYLKGLVSAVIDDCHKTYQAEVNEEAETIIKVAEALVKEVADPKSDKGCKEVIKFALEGLEDKKPFTTTKPTLRNDSAKEAIKHELHSPTQKEASISKPVKS